MKLCFATNNLHKIAEVKAVVPDQFELVSLKEIGCNEELPETGTTLEDNSFEKANYVKQNYKIDCFADDTGLEVAALDGRPGVYSARYAGLPSNSEKNVKKLMDEMSDKKDNSARFRTIITLLVGNDKYTFEGIMEGSIASRPHGTNGFGYDPIFIPIGHKQTYAEMTSDLKNSISHRAIAVSKLTTFLSSFPEGK